MMRIQRLVIDSSGFRSVLCELGAHFNADKSPYNKHPQLHRHPYTAVYQQLFAPFKNKEINFCEIGVAGGASAFMWMSYFPKANFVFADRDQNFLDNLKVCNHPKMESKIVDVNIDHSLAKALNGKTWDVILDDSSHEFNHQIRIIKEGFSFLKPGGLMIIEDIYRNADERNYENSLQSILPKCTFASFYICNHESEYTPGWNNSKLLVLVKE
jgi:predicted O-methyltransferase YrrM